MTFQNPYATTATVAVGGPFGRPTNENDRIFSIPEYDYSETDPDYWLQYLRRPGAPTHDRHGDPIAFRRVQSQMFDALQDAPGGFFAVGTGHGKSYVACLAGSVMPDVDLVIVFTLPSAKDDMEGFYLYLRQYFKVPQNFEVHTVHSLSQPRPDAELDLIEEIFKKKNIPPERTLIVFDEVHKLKNPKSSRGLRVLRFMQKYPAIRVVVLSGSMLSTSVHDCAHLAWAALRDRSPFPRTFGVDDAAANEALLSCWSACLDVKGEPTPADWQRVQPLWDWAYNGEKRMADYRGAERQKLLRLALQKRLRTCPGVIVSQEQSLQGVALVMSGITEKEIVIPEVVEKKLALVRSGVSPNEEDELADSAAGWPILRQLAQGFYYVWDWPGGVKDADWILARKRWNSAVRAEIAYRGDVKYDSAMLVYMAVKTRIRERLQRPEDLAWVEFVARTDQDNDLTGTGFVHGPQVFAECHERVLDAVEDTPLLWNWVQWSAVHKHKPEPPTKPVWVSPFFVDWVVSWAKRHADQKPILWYEHREIEAALTQRGIVCYGAGTTPPEDKAFTCGMSIAVQGTGKNLQKWHTNLVLCPPASGSTWEQMIARTHRPGQKASCVTVHVCQHTQEYAEAVAASYEKARNVHQTLDNEQKLGIAEYQNFKKAGLTST